MSSKEFNKEARKTHGRDLHGPDRHWCHDWDSMPIDATCSEYDCCSCDHSWFGELVSRVYKFWRSLHR